MIIKTILFAFSETKSKFPLHTIQIIVKQMNEFIKKKKNNNNNKQANEGAETVGVLQAANR